MTKKGRSVKEAIALSVGQMRENITITRAEAIISNPQVKIQANTHPNCEFTIYILMCLNFSGKRVY
jgi:translation elongation factor EF-Ts